MHFFLNSSLSFSSLSFFSPHPHVRSCMDIWPVSWTKWVIGERESEKENQSESAVETQGDRMFIYCRLEPHSGCEWKAVLSRTSHPLRPNSKHRQCSTKEGLHTVTKSPQAHTHIHLVKVYPLYTQTESLKLLRHTYRLNLQFPHTHTHTKNYTHSCLYQTGLNTLGWSCIQCIYCSLSTDTTLTHTNKQTNKQV